MSRKRKWNVRRGWHRAHSASDQRTKGKGVCLISGIDLDDAELAKLAAELKKKCGCGGAVKDGIIEIQGDKRDLIKSLLEAKGMKVKLAGG
jgi:translation initiation factor 1